jgi:chromosome segregation ATPase
VGEGRQTFIPNKKNAGGSMDFEQIVKRLQWLDEERRKDKAAITALEQRIAAYEGNLEAVAKQIKPLEKQINGLLPVSSRIDQFETLVAKLREETKDAITELDKKYQKREKEIAAQHVKDLEPLYKEIEALKKPLAEIPALKRDLKLRSAAENRLQAEIDELKPPIEEVRRIAEDAIRAQRVFDENRKQDMKRIADLQGEIAALRKRAEEAHTKVDTSLDAFRHLENRFKELLLSEAERKAAQAEFIEKQSIAYLDRERAFKEWNNSYLQFQKQIEALEAQSLALEETLRAAKRAQDTYNELNTRLERRINEVTEMQRLAEDRLRQEWVTFKADDQKRWTGYTLSQDEIGKDLRKALQKLEERISALDEAFQLTQDKLQQTTDITEQQLQELMNVAHEWLSAYERIMGHGQSPKKTRK